MKTTIILAAAVATLSLTVAAAAEDAGRLAIERAGAQGSQAAPAANFTGVVRLDQRFNGQDGADVTGVTVTFEPKARTDWHTHPRGQTLIVASGVGRIQREGGPIEEIRPGDVVWIPAGVKHWHGAGPTTAMSHIAIAERRDGKVADWMEKVTDAQYDG